MIQEIVSDRVRVNSPSQINEAIDGNIEDSVASYINKPASVIKERIEKLDEEWDIERVLELNASLIALTGVIMAATGSRKWLIVPLVVTGFLAQHAIKGWCPPLTLFRKLKVRTRKEIDMEKFALLRIIENRRHD